MYNLSKHYDLFQICEYDELFLLYFFCCIFVVFCFYFVVSRSRIYFCSGIKNMLQAMTASFMKPSVNKVVLD